MVLASGEGAARAGVRRVDREADGRLSGSERLRRDRRDAGSRRGRRNRAIEAESTFALIAELALGLAGFGGVAAAFGGIDRAFAPAELTRLRALFLHAALALAISLLATSLLWFDLPLASACRLASALGVAIEAPCAVYLTRMAHAYANDPGTSTSWVAFWLTAVPTWTAVGLFAVCAITGGSMGLLVSALSVQLMLGVWVFTRVLTVRN